MIRNILLALVLLATALIAFQLANQRGKADSSPDLSQNSSSANSLAGFTNTPGSARPNATTDSTSPSQFVSTAGPTSQPVTDGEFESGNALLVSAAQTLNFARPLEAALRYKIDLFGQQVAGPGFYVQAGQGTGRWRMELQGGAAPSEYLLTHVNDGQYYFLTEQIGDSNQVSFVDLNTVRDQLEFKNIASSAPWMNIGGLPSMLKHLAEHFEFQEPQQTTLGELTVYKTVGQWSPQAIQQMFQDIDGNYPTLHELPAHIPHAVQVVLGSHSDKFPLFPYRVTFFRIDESETSDSEQPKLNPVVVMEFFDVKRLDSVDSHLFYVDSNEERSINLTTEYVRQAKRVTHRK